MGFSCHWCGQSVRYVSRCPCGAEPSEEPGCPVRNAMACEPGFRIVTRDGIPGIESIHSVRVDAQAPSVTDETARERRVHGGGPREVC